MALRRGSGGEAPDREIRRSGGGPGLGTSLFPIAIFLIDCAFRPGSLAHSFVHAT